MNVFFYFLINRHDFREFAVFETDKPQYNRNEMLAKLNLVFGQMLFWEVSIINYSIKHLRKNIEK